MNDTPSNQRKARWLCVCIALVAAGCAAPGHLQLRAATAAILARMNQPLPPMDEEIAVDLEHGAELVWSGKNAQSNEFDLVDSTWSVCNAGDVRLPGEDAVEANRAAGSQIVREELDRAGLRALAFSDYGKFCSLDGAIKIWILDVYGSSLVVYNEPLHDGLPHTSYGYVAYHYGGPDGVAPIEISRASSKLLVRDDELASMPEELRTTIQAAKRELAEAAAHLQSQLLPGLQTMAQAERARLQFWRGVTNSFSSFFDGSATALDQLTRDMQQPTSPPQGGPIVDLGLFLEGHMIPVYTPPADVPAVPHPATAPVDDPHEYRGPSAITDCVVGSGACSR